MAVDANSARFDVHSRRPRTARQLQTQVARSLRTGRSRAFSYAGVQVEAVEEWPRSVHAAACVPPYPTTTLRMALYGLRVRHPLLVCIDEDAIAQLGLEVIGPIGDSPRGKGGPCVGTRALRTDCDSSALSDWNRSDVVALAGRQAAARPWRLRRGYRALPLYASVGTEHRTRQLPRCAVYLVRLQGLLLNCLRCDRIVCGRTDTYLCCYVSI
jgi:hypothetical protein